MMRSNKTAAAAAAHPPAANKRVRLAAAGEYDDDYVDVFVDEEQARVYFAKYTRAPRDAGSHLVTRTVTEWEQTS